MSDFWALLLSELYGYSMPLTTFLVMKAFLLHRLVLIVRPSGNSRARDKASSVRTILVSWENAQLLSVNVYIGACGGV